MADLKVVPVPVSTVAIADTTPPPQPTVRMAVAYDVIKRDDVAPARATGRGDPAYLEFGNVEAGTKFQLVNRSKKPDASFNSEKDFVTLAFDAQDLKNRRVSVTLSPAKMKELDLQPGDRLMVRAVDAAGNASAPVNFELAGNVASVGSSVELRRMVNAYEDVVSNVIAVPDTRAPSIAMGAVRIARPEVGKDGVEANPKLWVVQGTSAAEPGSIVRVQNTRTGATEAFRVGNDGNFKVQMLMEPGDALLMTATDSNSRLQDRPVTVQFAPGSSNGYGPDLGWSTSEPAPAESGEAAAAPAANEPRAERPAKLVKKS